MLEKKLNQHITEGTLEVKYPNGHVTTYGAGTPFAEFDLHNSQALRRLLIDPQFMLGQSYLEGAWSTPDLRALIDVLMRNFPNQPPGALQHALQMLVRPLQQWNRRAVSQRNVAHHYDLDEQLFRAFLDDDLQYSCAYWPPGVNDLEAAQAAKRALIRKKLCLQPGQRVLDIGCGWGGLAMEIAEHSGAQVVGLTLSEQQARVARERVRERGLAEQVDIRLQDYRDVPESFDRIVSVGMFEHVGVRYYRRFFRALQEHLAPDGIALIHTIGRSGPPTVTNPWIRRYIFPGGYIPALSEVAGAIEKQRLVIADVEVLRLHYAETLAHWFSRFQRVREAMVEQKGERFCRLWEFYLAACEGAFRWGDLVVFHLQISQQNNAVPLTRDYLC